MKKFTRTMALALVMAMMLSMTAFAAPKVEEEVEKTVLTQSIDSEKIGSLTYTDGDIANEGQYMIFVVNKEDGTYLPTASSILYINQKQATKAGEITFENIFPKTMKNSGIMISGTNLTGPELIAKILAALLGDVTGDEKITTADAQEILRFAASLSSVIENDKSEWLGMADITGDGKITTADAQEILRFAASLSSMLDEVYPKD